MIDKPSIIGRHPRAPELSVFLLAHLAEIKLLFLYSGTETRAHIVAHVAEREHGPAVADRKFYRGTTDTARAELIIMYIPRATASNRSGNPCPETLQVTDGNYCGSRVST